MELLSALWSAGAVVRFVDASGTRYVAEQMRAFRRLVTKAKMWTAIGADSEYGVVLSGAAQEYPLVNTWLAESAWRLHGFSGFIPARDRETALIIGDAWALACAVLAAPATPS